MLRERNFDEIIHLIKEKKVKKPFVQVPEGLKREITKLDKVLRENGFEPVFSSEPCFGACDLRDREAKELGCDVLLHLGHADFGVKPVLPVIYYEIRLSADFSEILEKNMDKISDCKNIGLMTTVQFVDEIGKVKEFLEKHGKNVFTGKNEKTGYIGHVLGCDFTAVDKIKDKCDCFIYMGSGKFHPSGFYTGKKVFSLDIESMSVVDMSDEVKKNEIRRQLSIEKARKMNKFIIYVSTKPGQRNLISALKAKKKLDELEKSSVILTADMLTPEKILGIDAEVIINTACPRISEDAALFGKVILNPNDMKEL